jgi:hypothetical protein
MSRSKLSIITVTLLILAAVLGVGSASAFPAGTWVSGIAVVNLSASDPAAIVVEFFDQDGLSVFDFADTVTASGQKSYYLPSVSGVPDGFVGSAVISSDQPVAANVNTQVPTTGTGTKTNPNRVGTSAAVAEPAPLAYAPQIMRGYWGWNSYCAVQNVSDASTTITEYIYDTAGTEVDSTAVSVPSKASYIFDHEDNSGLGSNFVGSSKYDGGGADVAVVCNFYNDVETHKEAQFQSYNGFSSGADVLYMPRVVKNYYNYQSGFKVQNIGTGSFTVEVTYFFGTETYTQTSTTIGPGQAWGPYLGQESQLPASMAGVSGSGSAIIVAPEGSEIVAMVNEDNRDLGRGSTYNAFAADAATHDVFFAQIVAEYYGYCGGFQIQNVEDTGATCTVTYNPGNIVVSGISVAGGTSYSAFAPNFVPINFNGSVSVSCDKNIVGIGNMSHRHDVDTRYPRNYGDSASTYNGINQ